MEPTMQGYLFAYFAGETTADGEQVRFAVSNGSTLDGWTELNGGQPVLRSTVGESGVRDPFILRDEHRGMFVVIATDLRVWPDHDWPRSYRNGSRSIVVWESADLVTWSQPWLLEVAPPDAGNAWAPKAFWSTERDAWAIFWASILYPDDDRSIDSPQIMHIATTTDFRSVSPAEPYLHHGLSVIDMTFLEHNGTWYRFSKSEEAVDGEHAGQHIFSERGTALLDPAYEKLQVDIGRESIARGEGPAVATSLDGTTWNLLIDEFGLRGYQLFETDDLDSGQWCYVEDARLPTGARHGSIIPITEDERARLLAYQWERTS